MSRLAVKLFRAALVGVMAYIVAFNVARLWEWVSSQIIRGLR